MEDSFAELIDIKWHSSEYGNSRFTLEIQKKHKNPHNVVHGGVIFSLADHGMGSALYTILEEEETCATIEIKINYFKPVLSSTLICMTKVIYKGRKTACIESELYNADKLIAKATGTYAIFPAKRDTI